MPTQLLDLFYSCGRILVNFPLHPFFLAQAPKPVLSYFEPLMRIELTTSSLPRKCSTTELQWLVCLGLMITSTRILIRERKTRLELATYSLEGYRSTK
jgi:hypothetical protein